MTDATGNLAGEFAASSNPAAPAAYDATRQAEGAGEDRAHPDQDRPGRER